MAKDITLKSRDGGTTYYPKTVSDLVYDNSSGQTVKQQFDALGSDISKLRHYVSDTEKEYIRDLAPVKGYYKYSDGTISIAESDNWYYSEILPIDQIAEIRTAGGNEGSIVPAVVFFGSNNIADVVSVAYGDIPTISSVVNYYDETTFPVSAKYFAINIHRTFLILDSSFISKMIPIKGKVAEMSEEISEAKSNAETALDIATKTKESITFEGISTDYALQSFGEGEKSFYKITNGSLSKTESAGWRTYVIAAINITHIKTTCGFKEYDFPVAIWLSDNEVIDENVVGITYQTGGSGARLFDEDVQPPISAKYVVISCTLSELPSASVVYTEETTARSRILKLENDISKSRQVVVDANGKGNYTSLTEAIENEPEGTTIHLKEGVYDGTIRAFQKSINIIGVDRNQCIIRQTDGRYANPVIECSCGYIENVTIYHQYVQGESTEIDDATLGGYAVHCEFEYGVGKTLEFHHCTIKSDFFPAVGAGLRKDFTLILDDCILENNQVEGRGTYSRNGSLGALYFHDSNGVQGEQGIIVKNCLLKSSLGKTMTPYTVDRNPQNNIVKCIFVNNVLYDKINKYENNIYFRNNPFEKNFILEIGYGNSNDSLNN